MVVRLASLVLYCLMAVAAQARSLLVEDAQIAALRANAKAAAALLRKCDKEKGEALKAVADFAPGPHYTASGASPDDDVAKGLTGDIRRAYRAALCYRLSGDAAYAAQVQAIADGWAGTMKSASTPQGRSDINFNMAQLVVAASWVEGANGWDSGPFKAWLGQVILPLSLAQEPNNRGNWGVLLEAAIASFTHDTAALARVGQRWRTLLSEEIAADGTLPREICRSNSANHCDGPDKGVNGLAYTHYALLPATLAGTLLRQAGQPAFADAAVAQKWPQAYATTLGFTLKPETFPYYASNHGQLNKVDACSYFPLLRMELLSAGLGPLPAGREGTCSGDYWLLKLLFVN